MSVDAGDIDGDGDADVVVANLADGTVSVLLNRGDGAFDDQVAYAATEGLSAVRLVDVDADGCLDVVVSLYWPSGGIGVLHGAGNGTFGEPHFHEAGVECYNLAVADVDGDGSIDIAAASYYDDYTRILFGHCNR